MSEPARVRVRVRGRVRGRVRAGHERACVQARRREDCELWVDHLVRVSLRVRVRVRVRARRP